MSEFIKFNDGAKTSVRQSSIVAYKTINPDFASEATIILTVSAGASMQSISLLYVGNNIAFYASDLANLNNLLQ